MVTPMSKTCVLGKPKGERGARACRTCLLWERMPDPVFQHNDWDYNDRDSPQIDRLGWCQWPGHHQAEVREVWFWCDAWVPDLSKL